VVWCSRGSRSARVRPVEMGDEETTGVVSEGGEALVHEEVNGEDAGAGVEADAVEGEPYSGIDQDVVRAGLGRLAMTADGVGMAYVSLRLHGKGLHTVQGLEGYTELREVDVSGNPELVDLRPLAAIPALEKLNASGTGCTGVLAGWGPAGNDLGYFSLRCVDLSDTKVGESIGSASYSAEDEGAEGGPLCTRFPDLEQLRLSGNHLTNVGRLVGLTRLKVLHLARNQMTDVGNLAALVSLRELDLSGNSDLMNIEPLGRLIRLRKVDLSNTSVNNLSALATCEDLETLLVMGCKLAQTKLFRDVSSLSCLRHLWASNNPGTVPVGLVNLKDIYLEICYTLPMLITLDGSPVPAVDKVFACNMVGKEDSMAREVIRAKYFPEGNVDTVLEAAIVSKAASAFGQRMAPKVKLTMR